MANEWSQDLLNELKNAGQAFEEAALSGDPRIPEQVQQQVARNRLYEYYRQQKANQRAARAAVSSTKSIINNAANELQSTDGYYSAIGNALDQSNQRVQQLKKDYDEYSQKAKRDMVSQFSNITGENQKRAEETKSALAQAVAENQKIKADLNKATAARGRKTVDEAFERGVGYADQYEAYGKSLEELNKQKAQLTEQLEKKYSRANNKADFGTRKKAYDEEKDRIEKLERDIARIEGVRSYAEQYLTKDAGAKAVIEQGRKLAEVAEANKQEREISALDSDNDGEGFAAAVRFRREERAGLKPDDRWTEDQKDLYYLFLGSGDREKAEEYAARINYAYNQNTVEQEVKPYETWGAGDGKSKGSKALRGLAGIVGSVAGMPSTAADYINKMLDVAATGQYAGRDFALTHDYYDALTRGRSKQLNKDYGEVVLPLVGKRGLGDVYQLTQSMAQSLALGNIAGEAATLGAFFFQAANSSFDEAMQRGANAQYAALYSTLCGTAEVAFEKISLDKLLADKNWSKQLVKELVSQGLVEGSEELFTSLANEMNDRIAAAATGQRPKMEQEISALVAQGMSVKDAQHQVWTQFVHDLAWDAIGGAISGFGSGAVQTGVRGTQNKLWDMRKDSVLGTKGGAHIAGKDGKAIGRTQAANASDAQLEKLLVQAEKRGDLQTALFLANELINREEAGQRQRPTGDPDSTSMLAERILDGMRRKAGVIQDGDGLGETPLNDDELPPPHEEERPPMPGDEEAPPEWASKRQEEPTVGEQRNGNEPPARSDREAPPAWRNRNADLGSAQQKSALELELDEQEAEMRQNAARAQRAAGGQITQPSQQNAAQTVKPGDSEKEIARPKLPKNNYYFYDDQTDSVIKEILRDDFARVKEVSYGNSQKFVINGFPVLISKNPTGGDFTYYIKSKINGRTIKSNSYQSSAESAFLMAAKEACDTVGSGSDRIVDLSPLITSTESGTMSVPNTQEVTTNAGEQTVRTDAEEWTGEPARVGNGQTGRQAERSESGVGTQGQSQVETQRRAENGKETPLPRFVTEEDRATLSAKEDSVESDALPPEQKDRFEGLLSKIAQGTRIITKPKIGSRVHFMQQLFKKLGVADDFLFARNDNTSVFKSGAAAKQQMGKVVIDANSDLNMMLSKGVHDYSHKKLWEKFGGGTARSILEGAYGRRLSFFNSIFSDAFGKERANELVKKADDFIKSDDGAGYGRQYKSEHSYIVNEVLREIQKNPQFFNSNAYSLVSEMEDARALEEFFNFLFSLDTDYVDDMQYGIGLTDDEMIQLRKSTIAVLEQNGIISPEDTKAINDALREWDDLNGTFTDDDYDETDWPSFPLAEDEFEDLGDPFIPTENAYGKERQRELAATLRTLISGDAEAIGRLSTDYLNYAINYTLKKADPDLDFKEKRRTYNAIANVLSGMNIDTFGYDRNVARNESNDKNNAGFDGMMSKAPNKLFYAVSSRTQADDYEGGRRGMSTIGNLQPGQYRPTGNAADMQTVLRNAINELDRRGLNIWGKENSNRFEYDEETDDTGKQYERSDADFDYFSQYNSATYGDSKAEDDYSDEYNEGEESRESKLRAKDQRAAEKREATAALRRLKEGDNWLEGAVKVTPEAKEWGRGAKKTAGQKTQGWYDINRRSSLSVREFARQRVMNARAAEDLSYEIQSMEDQAASTREEIEIARRNSPKVKESLKMIDAFLEELNEDIDDLHAIDDMFRDAVHENPNSDMTKQLATEGTRLVSEIENLRRSIDTLGRLANESIANNNSDELRDAEKRLKKQEQKIKAKREHLQELLDKSHGGDKSGALVASRAETAFDSMPDDVIKQIIRNDYVSMDMLQDYYGDSDMAFQTMYEFQERVGDTGKTRVPSVHKLTSLERTALHGILADRKKAEKAGKITSGYGGVEVREPTGDVSQYNNYGMGENVSNESQYQNETITDKERAEFAEQERQLRLNAKGYPLDSGIQGKTGVEKQTVSDDVRQRNLETYQNAMAPAGMVYEPSSGPVAANMDRLNRMFADRLGIKNKGNTAISYGKMADAGTWEDDSGILDITENANAKEEKKPLVVDAAYTNYAAAAQSVADLHKKIVSDIMAEYPNAEPDAIDKQIEDSFLGSSVRALDTAVSQIANSKDPLGAVFDLRQKLYSAKNKGEGTYAALTSDAVIGMCGEIGRLIENKTMPYDEKAKAYAVATTQLVSALSTRAERLYEAAHRVQRIQDKLATVTKKDRGKLKEALTGYKIMQMNPTTLFKMLDNFDVGGKGAGYEIARALENGTVKSAELIARAARQFDEAKKTEGFQEFAEGKTNARYKFKGEYTISELQAIEFILLARRMNGMKVYDVDAHGGVIEKTRLQTLKGFALRDADGNHIFVDSMYEDSSGRKKKFDWYKEAESMYRNLSPAANAYLKAVNKVMDGLGKEIRQAKINTTGIGFTGMEGTGYYPISYMSDKEHLPDYNTKPDYEGLSHDKHLEGPRLTYGGYAVVQNAAQVVDRYVEWASNYAGFADIADMLQTMNVSGNGRGIVNATADAYGVKYAKAIERYIGDVNNFTDVSREHTENSTLRALRQNMAAGALGLSLSVPVKQVASYWDAAGILSMDSLRRAYRVKAFVKEKGLGADNMFLKSRQVGNVDPTVSEMMGNGLMDNLKKRSSIVKLFAEATNRMDYKTVDNLFTATVLDVEANLPGIDKDSDLFKRAVESKFNQVVLNTQPIFNKNARSEYQRSSNEWQRLFSMFRTQQTQNFNRLIVTTMEAKAAKGTSLEAATKRQLRQTIAGQVAGQLEFAALTALANFVMHGWKRWRDDDDEITVESVVKRFGLDAAESIAGVAWFGDELAKVVADKIFDTNESYGVSMGAISTLADVIKYFGNVIDSLKSDAPLAQFDNMRKFAGAVATLGGKPLNNTYRLANAAVMWGADILKWASKGKYGNRANYDDALKMFDAWIKGGLKEEGAKKQAAKAFRNDQPENLLYNLGILSSLTEEGKKDKGQDWLNERIKGKTKEEKEAYLKNELAEFGRNRSSSERILDYLVKQAISAEKVDEAVDKYATTGGYNVLYESLREAGMTPQAAAAELASSPNKSGLSTDIMSDDNLATLYEGKDEPGTTNDIPKLEEKNTEEYVNFVSAMRVFENTGNYKELDKLVDKYGKLDENTRAVLDVKDKTLGKYLQYRKAGLSTKDYEAVKEAIKDAQWELDISANTGSVVKLLGLTKTTLNDRQIDALIEADGIELSKTMTELRSILKPYGFKDRDIAMWMYMTDYDNHGNSNGTLSQVEVVKALERTKGLTDTQREEIYQKMKEAFRDEGVRNHWYDSSYTYERDYFNRKGLVAGRNAS